MDTEVQVNMFDCVLALDIMRFEYAHQKSKTANILGTRKVNSIVM
jgi:hypothetical protein